MVADQRLPEYCQVCSTPFHQADKYCATCGKQRELPAPSIPSSTSSNAVSRVTDRALQPVPNGLDLVPSAEQLGVAVRIEESDAHYFVTGAAGTGKSYLLRLLAEHTRKKAVVVAPTGIAALNADGETIHSLFRLPPTFIDRRELQLSGRTKGVLAEVEMIIIDEISMVRADIIEAVDECIQQAKNSKLAFGGVQVIMFGDLYQLPPIVRESALRDFFLNEWGGPFFFNAPVWKSERLNSLELQQVFRQRSTEFVCALNGIRTGKFLQEHFDLFQERVVDTSWSPPDGTVVLAPRNETVDSYNREKLAALQSESRTYTAVVTGRFDRKSAPTASELVLKAGAQVMLLSNSTDGSWKNGTIGTVHSFEDDAIIVEIDEVKKEVLRYTWDQYEYVYNRESKRIEQTVVGTFTQFPLRLAWSLTIHKSQGRTFDSVAVDLRNGGSFDNGQTYVAVSRCANLEKLYLYEPLTPKDVTVNSHVRQFMKAAFTAV